MFDQNQTYANISAQWEQSYPNYSFMAQANNHRSFWWIAFHVYSDLEGRPVALRLKQISKAIYANNSWLFNLT